jgi:hypothetical protein
LHASKNAAEILSAISLFEYVSHYRADGLSTDVGSASLKFGAGATEYFELSISDETSTPLASLYVHTKYTTY